MFSYYKPSSGQESQRLGFEVGAGAKFGKRISYWTETSLMAQAPAEVL
jgi:hypothetical protein